jgi:glutaminyl-peptide cyclotransferase
LRGTVYPEAMSRPHTLALVGFVFVGCVSVGCLLALTVSAQVRSAKTFSGAEAFAYTARAVAFGPRPDGSAAIAGLRAYIRKQLAGCSCEVTADRFTAQTPDGPLPMENIIVRFPGKSGRAIAVSGHYDTKKMAGFVGANDGGSSTGFLLELAAVLKSSPRTDDIYLVFFDGEEAVREWSDSDSVYGSRHLAEKWKGDGTNRKLKALMNVDMIGDKNFRLVWETGSTPSLLSLVWDIADSLGHPAAFPRQGGPVSDDHMPFINAGVPALDLIDFESQSTFWHTPEDTMDKLSPKSFEIVGQVVMEAISRLESRK